MQMQNGDQLSRGTRGSRSVVCVWKCSGENEFSGIQRRKKMVDFFFHVGADGFTSGM